MQGGQVPTKREEAQATPCRASYRGRDEGRDSEADGSFAAEVDGVGFDMQKAAVIGSVKAVWKTLSHLAPRQAYEVGRSYTVRLTSTVRHIARVHATQRSIDYGRRARNPLLCRKARNWTSLNNLSPYII